MAVRPCHRQHKLRTIGMVSLLAGLCGLLSSGAVWSCQVNHGTGRVAPSLFSDAAFTPYLASPVIPSEQVSAPAPAADFEAVYLGHAYLDTLQAVPAVHGFVTTTTAEATFDETTLGEDFVSVPIQPGHSGAWSSPERDGEGIQVEILGPDTAVVFWFTYPAGASVQEGQFWMGRAGRIEGNQIIIDGVVSTSGTVFGPDFNPDDVVRTPWGRFVVEFSSCGEGRIVYEGPPEFGSGTVPVQRITGNPRTPCGADAATFLPPSIDVPGVSGNWFDPSHDGEGWFIQELAPGVAGFNWLTYTPTGEQAWILGVGFWNGRTLLVPSMQITRGTAFGNDFDPASVIREPWGQVQFVFDNCTQATVVYNSSMPGFGAGVLQPVRLTNSVFLPCAFETLTDLNGGAWQVQTGAPALSEMPTATIGDAIYVAGGFQGGFRSRVDVWRHRPATGEWTQVRDLPQARDHGMMTALDGRLYFFGGFIQGIPTTTAWRYDPASDRWESLASMPHSRAAGGAVNLDGLIYVLGGDARFIDRYDPQSDTWVSFELPEVVGRDHSSAVVLRDEIWLLGGRNAAGAAHGSVTIFNPLTGVVRPGPAMQRGRSGFAAAVLDGQVVVAGGEDFVPAATIGSVEFYSPETDSWQFTTALPTPVHGVSATVFDGRLYLMLGSVRTGGVNNPGIVQVFTPQ